MPKLPQTFLNLVIGILIINVIGLWTVYLLPDESLPSVSFSPAPQFSYKQESSKELEGIDLSAKNSQEIEELEAQFAELETHVASLDAQVAQKSQNKTVTTSSSSPQESYIFLGSGSTTNRDWTALSGTITSINTAYYKNVKSVVFEADLSAVGGEAHARLINKSTGAIINATEVSNNTQHAQWKSSGSFALTPGDHEYQVQLRSSSGEVVNLTGARIKIITN